MKNMKIAGIAVLLLAVVWHVVVAMTAKINVCGIFLLKPADPGYTWHDETALAESRFFWQSTRLKWQAALAHPDYKAETSDQEGVWNPMPGYKFVDKAVGLSTVWETGLKHPDYMAWSDDVEGQWIPVTGYKFIYEGDTFVNSVWDPGKRYDDLKVISLQEQDRYQPFPGYRFIEPGKSLHVMWVPGLVNSDNSRLVAGAREGTWRVNYQPVRVAPSGNNNVAAFILGGITGAALHSALR